MPILLATDFDVAEQRLWRELLQTELPDERFVTDRQTVDDATIDIAIVANPPRGALSGLANLRLIQSLWAGVDRLLGDPSVPPQVAIARMVDPAMNVAMAETALWAVLSLHRGYYTYAAQQRARHWQSLPQRRADEIAVAVLGLGQMGRTVALRLADQGYRVSGWSTRPAEPARIDACTGDDALLPLLARADIVVNLLPLTPATRGLLCTRIFDAMPQGASLVNLARGAHVVDADLLAALDRGHLRHAVLDVFATEPLPADHRYWLHPNVTVLPHAAAQTDARSAATVAAANVRRLRAGESPQNQVDRVRGY
ncbi:MAG: glyoxylate/hydroxypyruvate reductase A [Burkholderiaceae bacterium]|nr:glyoxylate/hydroxypyruvate reductase A [Burkholderiaceae bacterium]